MKILVVHEISYLGGPVFEFQEFTEAFLEAGHEVLVLDVDESRGPRGRPASFVGQNYTVEGRSSSQKVNLVTPHMRFSNDWLRPFAVPIHFLYLVKIFLRWRPHVVLSYSVPTSGLSVALLGKLFRIPTVHRAIDVSHLLRPGVYESVVRLFEFATFKLSDYVSTHNGALADYIVSHGGSHSKVFIHYPPVDTDFFQTIQSRYPENCHNVIFVGTLANHCGLDKVINSLDSLTDDKKKWRLRIVGDGPLGNSLWVAAQKSPHFNRIEFRGWVDYTNLSHELAWANVAIVPFEKTLLTDLALPQKTIQYLAAGLPVVSTSLNGSLSELKPCNSVRFVDSPEGVMAVATSGITFNHSDKSWVAARFQKEAAVERMLLFLENAKRDFQK